MSTPLPVTSPVPYALALRSSADLTPNLWALAITFGIVALVLFILCHEARARVKILEKNVFDLQESMTRYKDVMDSEMDVIKANLNIRNGRPLGPHNRARWSVYDNDERR